MAMRHVFELFIPTECMCGQPIPEPTRQKAVEDAKLAMAAWFGGGTAATLSGLIQHGFWSNEGLLVDETVEVIYSNSDDDAYAKHREDFLDYAADMAHQLTQYYITCRIDGVLHLLEGPHNGPCLHKQPPDPNRPKPPSLSRVREISRLRSLRAGLARLNDSSGLRDVFCNILHYAETNQMISTERWPSAIKDLLSSGRCLEVVAEHNGFTVVHVPLNCDRIRADAESRITRRLLETLPDFRGMLVFSSSSADVWHFVYPVKSLARNGSTGLRRLRISREETLRTAVEQLAAMDIECLGREATADEIDAVCANAFNVEGITEAFFRTYKSVFTRVRDSVFGFTDAQDEERHLFTQQLFNRLMFVAFAQRKRWLRHSGSTDYLNALWKDYLVSRHEQDNFYRDRLKPLFFGGLNAEVSKRGDVQKLIGDVPFVNGGLFEPSAFDKQDEILVPDRSIELILFDLFARFNFTVSEGTPLDEDVAVDPEMLGRVFEELVIGRHEQGSYYTPKAIVQFMCREALKCYLENVVPEETSKAVADFVDERDPSELQWPEGVLDALRRVKVCDPACGSGAYLLGMLHELLELRTCLFVTRRLDPISMYKRKLEIIQNNLYGVDIDPFAVNIARFRLWLSLSVEFEGEVPPALPNLDFKIEVGNSLTGPCVDARGLAQDLVDQYQKLKFDYMMGSPEDKEELLSAVNSLRQEIAQWTQASGSENGFDWSVEFAEVFAQGGFDIVLTNPPYVRHELIKDIKPALKNTYGNLYCTTADLYVYFYIRGLQLLRYGGTLAFISSNKWFRSSYGEKLRKHVADSCRIVSITDFGELPVFSAATFPMIFIAQKSNARNWSATFTQVQSLDPPYPDVLAIVRERGQLLPAGAFAGANWTLASHETADALAKMRAAGVPLSEYVGGRMYRGVLTGCNRAFVIDDRKREELITADPRSAEIIKPLVVGDDIRKWRIENRGRWLLFVRHGTDIERYPAVRRHLENFRSELEPRPVDWPEDQTWAGRKPGPYNWYEIQDTVAYYSVFEEPKILYPEIAMSSRFVFDSGRFYPMKTVFSISTADLFLLGVLNSALVWDFLKSACPVLGDAEQRGRLLLQSIYVSRVPIPSASDADRSRIAALVQKCLDARGENCETSEREIDQRVAALYGL